MVRPLPEYLYTWPIIGEVARWLNEVCYQIQVEIKYWAGKIYDLLPKEVKDAIEKFKDFVKTAWEKFKLLVTNPRQFFKEIFDFLWSLLPDWARRLIIQAEDFLRDCYIKLRDFLRDPVGTLRGIADKVWDALPDWLKNAITTTKDTVISLPGQIIAKAGEIKDLIWNKVKEWIEGAKDKVKEWGETLRNSLDSARDKILGAFDGAQSVIGLKLGALPGDWWSAFWNFWTRDFPAGVSTVFSFLSPFKLISWIKTLMGYGKGIVQEYKSPIERLYNELSRLVRGQFKGDPITEYMTIMSVAAEVVAEVEMSTAAIELAVPWKTTGLGGALGAALLDTVIGGTVGGVHGTFLDALLRPVTKWLNENLRGNFPDIGTASLMFYRGKLREEDLKQILRWQGYDDVYINAWLDMIKDRVPDIGTARTMLLRGAITEDDFEAVLKYQGFPEKYRKAYRALIYEIPSESSLLRMWFKGIIDEKTLDKLLKARGYDDNTINRLKQDAWYYPPVQDMITFFVREAIPAVHGEIAKAKLVGLPKEFYDYARKAGLPAEWVEAYWAAHWKLPSIEQVYEMFWRGLKSPYTGAPMIKDDVVRFLTEQDIDPRWRDNLVEIAYKLPGKIEARWALEWGIWDEAMMEKFLKAEGLHPDYVSDVIAIEKKNVFREHYNAVMSAAKRAFQRGFMTKEEYLNIISRLGYPKEVQELRAWEADLLFDIELKEDEMKYVIQQYRDGEIDEAQLRNMLSSIIVDPVKLEKIIQLEVALKQRRKVEKPTIEEQIAALERRKLELQRRLIDLSSDLEQAKKIRDAEMAIWDAKIAKQEELIRMAVKPEQVEKLKLALEVMLRQRERARIYHANKIAELEETINFVRQDLEAVESQIEALRRAAAA